MKRHSLAHGQLIRLASWTNSYAKFGTVEGYGFEAGTAGIDWSVRRALAERHHLAWTSYVGSCLSNDPTFYEGERKKYLSAIVVADGDLIRAEGRMYRVKVVQGNGGQFPKNSDPIHFTPVDTEATLCEALAAFQDHNGLPRQCAEEQLSTPDLSFQHRAWLREFAKRWDALMQEKANA